MRIIAGRHRGCRLLPPSGHTIRPTSDRAREALFGILEHDRRQHGHPGLRGARFLDLFCGTGAVGLEACSRGASHVLLVDADPAARRLAEANLARLGTPSGVRVRAADATRLGPAPMPFDLVFLDPPYRSALAAPALVGLGDDWLAPDALIVVELAARDASPMPEGYDPDRERRYGAARFLFLRRRQRPGR